MVGMLLVNFLGGFDLCPRILKHTHDYCSYADTIMPHFLFSAGFALRLGWARLARTDRATRWRRIARRFVGLSLIAIVWYSIGDRDSIGTRFHEEGLLSTLEMLTKRTWFQTLLHLSVTSLWITPVVGKSIAVRVGWAAGSGLLHVVLSWGFNFVWVNTGSNGIDGGPLGFLTWSIPAIAGTVACDLVQTRSSGLIRRLIFRGALVASLGYTMSTATTLYDRPRVDVQTSTLPAWFGPANAKLAVDPVVPQLQRIASVGWRIPERPFVSPPGIETRQWNYWMMSQRGGTLSYCVFSAGISLIVFAVFVGLSDRCGWQMGVFRTLGTNALSAYILHEIAGELVEPWVSSDSSAARVLLAFTAYFLMTYGACRFLEWKRWFLRM